MLILHVDCSHTSHPHLEKNSCIRPYFHTASNAFATQTALMLINARTPKHMQARHTNVAHTTLITHLLHHTHSSLITHLLHSHHTPATLSSHTCYTLITHLLHSHHSLHTCNTSKRSRLFPHFEKAVLEALRLSVAVPHF